MKGHCIPLFLVFLILLVPLSTTHAGSAEGDPAPPSGGSSNSGGGGGPDIFYYFIPLIFGENHTDGESKVVIWTFQPTQIQTSFSIDNAGLNSLRLDAPSRVEFSPSTSPGLTNGSLIITVGPAQVVGMRDTQDILSDTSFSYSILPARMMGFEYISPFDGYFSVFTRSQNTELRTSEGDFYIADPFESTTIPVHSGEYINSTQPIIGAFYSQDNSGTSASLGVPFFLQGKEYIFNGDLSANRAEEVDHSFIKVIPSTPTELNITYSNGTVAKSEIFGETQLYLDENIRGVSALRGRITVSIEKVVDYSYIARRSTVELMAAPEMRAGELFSLFDGFSTSLAIINPSTNLTVIEYTNQGYILSTRDAPIYGTFDALTYGQIPGRQLVLGNHSLFAIASSPGYATYAMAPSMSFLPFPMNTQTIYRNVTGATATWYRFTNLAVESIEFLPSSPEKFTGLKLRVTFISNGTLPAGNFSLTISINDELVVDDSVSFLRVNDTIVYEFDEFLQFDKSEIKVLAKIDTQDSVSELDENDNEMIEIKPIANNLRIDLSLYLFITLIVLYIIRRIYLSWKKKKQIEKSKFDAILEIQEELEDE